MISLLTAGGFRGEILRYRPSYTAPKGAVEFSDRWRRPARKPSGRERQTGECKFSVPVFVNVVVPIFMRLFVEESVSDRARGRLAKRHR